MRLIDLIAYSLMFAATITWMVILYGFFALPKVAAILLAMLLGPVTVMGVAFAVTRIFERK